MSWWAYVQRVSKGANQTDIGKAIGVSGPTINRWQSSAPKPANVAAFARAYKRPILEAFIEAGYLSREEAAVNEIPADLTEVSDDDLLAEVRRRLTC